MADPEYFTTAEFRALPEMADTSAYPEAAILAAAAYFVEIVEREVYGNNGLGFVPRTLTETLDGNGCTDLVLPHVKILSLTSVTVDGVSVTVGLLTAEKGILRYKAAGTTWPATGPANIVAVYSAGEFATCPADMKDAVMWATRDRLLSQDQRTGSDARRSSVNTEFGTTNYVLPGEKRPTGYPELDALIASYMRSTPSYGFA